MRVCVCVCTGPRVLLHIHLQRMHKCRCAAAVSLWNYASAHTHTHTILLPLVVLCASTRWTCVRAILCMCVRVCAMLVTGRFSCGSSTNSRASHHNNSSNNNDYTLAIIHQNAYVANAILPKTFRNKAHANLPILAPAPATG